MLPPFPAPLYVKTPCRSFIIISNSSPLFLFCLIMLKPTPVRFCSVFVLETAGDKVSRDLCMVKPRAQPSAVLLAHFPAHLIRPGAPSSFERFLRWASRIPHSFSCPPPSWVPSHFIVGISVFLISTHGSTSRFSLGFPLQPHLHFV